MPEHTIHVPEDLTREFPIELGARQEGGEGEERADLYPITFSSEEPVERVDWWTGEKWYEVLSHEPGDVDLSRAEDGLVFLQSHQRMIVLGSLNDVTIGSDRKSHAMLGFSSIPVAQDQKTLVDEGHVRTVSVGYKITGMRLDEVDENGIATYRCRWMPYESSLEPIPADHTVGIGRALPEAGARSEEAHREFTVAMPEERGERSMPEKTGQEVVTPTGSPEVVPERVEVTREFSKEAAEITELAQSFGRSAEAPTWIREQRSPDYVRMLILEDLRTNGKIAPSAEVITDMPKKDRARYSVLRAVQLGAKLRMGTISEYDGVEGEVDAELRKNRPDAQDRNGICIPWRMKTRDELEAEWRALRTLGTGEATGGASLVGMQPQDMIDLLRNTALCLAFGARLYPGLQGVVPFPRKDAAASVSWMAENPASDAAESEPDYGYVNLTPKTLIGSIEVPRQLLTMASIDVEADLRNDLALGHGLALDLGALHGSGTASEPLGIWNTPDVGSEAMSDPPTYAELIALAGDVATANAILGSLAYMTTPAMAAVQMVKPKIGTTMPIFNWEGGFADGTIGGYKAAATNQVSSTLGAGAEHGIFFGNWNDLLVGLWGNDLEIVVDPYTKAKKGQIQITSFSMADTAVARPGSFSIGTGAALA